MNIDGRWTEEERVIEAGAYDEAVVRIFETLDHLETRLSNQRYLRCNIVAINKR